MRPFSLFAAPLLLTLAGTFSTACATDEPAPTTQPRSEAARLLVGAWSTTQVENRIGTAPWQPVDKQQCHLDNVEEYGADGSWALYDGTNPCSAGKVGGGPLRGTWRLAAGDRRLLFTYEDALGEYECTVEELTANRLVITLDSGDLAGTQIRRSFER